MTITRRQLLGSAVAAGGASLITLQPARADPYDKGPPLKRPRVEQMVGAAHSRIEIVRELLEEDQGLANACRDWGGGDFETALGAAAHTGQRDIALLLLERGARLDLFAAAMLGMTDVVRIIIETRPLARFTLGPHGIPLVQHALAGGDAAAGVVTYLKSLRSNDDGGDRDFPLSQRELGWYKGAYGDQPGAQHVFTGDGTRLAWRAADQANTPLRSLGNHEFVPVGRTQPLLSFDFRQGHARRLHLRQAEATAAFDRID